MAGTRNGPATVPLDFCKKRYIELVCKYGQQ